MSGLPPPSAPPAVAVIVEQLNNLGAQVDNLDLTVDERLTQLENFKTEAADLLKDIVKGLEALDARLKELEAWRKR